MTGFFIGKSCKSGDLSFTLNQAIKNEKITINDQLKLRSDNGPQMSSNKFFFYLKRLEQKLVHEFIPPRTPNKNAFIESFFSILENELLVDRYFKNYGEAYAAVCNFISFYNKRRLHGSLDYKSPERFILDYQNGLIKNYQVSA